MKRNRKKSILSVTLVILILIGAFSMPASAADPDEIYKENLYARIYGGATVSSSSAKKIYSGQFKYGCYKATADGWSSKGDEWIYLRGRNSTGTVQATGLAHMNFHGYQRSGSLSYLSGHGQMNTRYKVAIEYDNTNPYEYVVIETQWQA